MNRFISWLLICVTCLLVAVWAVIALPISAAFGTGKKAWRMAVSFDQLGNTAAGGDEDETFSARCWRCREKPVYARLVRFIDSIYAQFGEAQHCRKAYEAEAAKCRGSTQTIT